MTIPLKIKTHREWTNPEGYRELAVWSNARLLEILIRKFTLTLVPVPTPKPALNAALKMPLREYRLKAQTDDCARSVVANIEEGFKRPTTREYLDFLGFSQGSLEEVKGDISRSLHNELVKSVPDSCLADLGINLKDWNKWCKVGANEPELLEFKLRANKGNYRQLREIKGQDLTYEMFMELINKTDYLLRNLVTSLQKSGQQKEELKKNPDHLEAKKADKWLDKYMNEKGYMKLSDGRWVESNRGNMSVND